MGARKFKYDGMTFVHNDAPLNAFLARQLEYLEMVSYDTETPELFALKFVPIKGDIPDHVTSWKYRSFTKVGAARLLASYADDIPRADLYMVETDTPIRPIGMGYGIDVDELNTARATGTNLESMKAEAAKHAVDVLIDNLLAFGDADAGLPGFINAASALSYIVPNGGGGTAPWSAKTPLEIVADMVGICRYIPDSTGQREKPDMLLLPTTQYFLVATTPMSASNPFITILKYFEGVMPGVKVDYWPLLSTAGTLSSARMIAYKKDVKKIAGVLPLPFQLSAPQPNNFEWKVPGRAKCGGTHAIYPLSMAQGDGI